MAFKLRSSGLQMDNTPIYQVDMDDNVLGMAQNNGSILVNKNMLQDQLEKSKTVSHEKVHLDQMKRGDLDYTDTDVFWKGKKYPRSKMDEGAKSLPWEQEAYKKQ
jgi:oxalate decarboxylase/phosphoglucose isomerase-like protein (cupin superfamily)